ncbi:MAG: HEAT repeat domain-containing protein, partial [Gammaproteobacteria bacterium]
KSDQVIEATVAALSKQQDPRAIPALRHAANGPYDDFLKFSIARAQLALGDPEGFGTLIRILKDDEAAYARQQAHELLEARSGQKFGYEPERTVAQNATALKHIEEWYSRKGSRLNWDAKTGKFH